MGARVNKIRHDEETRAKIQAAQIINRLMGCINGEIELTSTQVTAAKTLLNKVLPDLQAVSMDTAQGPMQIQVITGVPRANRDD